MTKNLSWLGWGKQKIVFLSNGTLRTAVLQGNWTEDEEWLKLKVNLKDLGCNALCFSEWLLEQSSNTNHRNGKSYFTWSRITLLLWNLAETQYTCKGTHKRECSLKFLQSTLLLFSKCTFSASTHIKVFAKKRFSKITPVWFQETSSSINSRYKMCIFFRSLSKKEKK